MDTSQPTQQGHKVRKTSGLVKKPAKKGAHLPGNLSDRAAPGVQLQIKTPDVRTGFILQPNDYILH
jgi:hypothetical protein